MSNREKQILEQSVEALRKALGNRLVAVVLFGSRAREDARPDSDWDLLVIAKGLIEDPPERGRFLRQVLPSGCRGAIALLARTPEEFEGHLASLYLDIALDGRIVHDPTGYVAERLATLRRLIKKAGLYRERTRAGDVWRWKEPPHGDWIMSWEKIGSL